MQTQELKLSQLRIDGGTQPRVAINEEAVADYAERLREGVVLPPVVAFFDGVVYWLADGFHRYHAHRRAGREAIAVDVHDGGLREAILYSVGANTEHGLRRTNEDKRKAVETLLNHEIASLDENGNPWNNCEIARRCHVDEGTVRNYRKNLSSEIPKMEAPDRLVKRGNSVYTQNTAKIGKSKSKKRKQYGQLAPNAFKPVRSGRAELPQTALQLPHDPHYAARAIVDAMGRDFSTKLIDALTHYLKGTQA
jgi:hypothetical protein